MLAWILAGDSGNFRGEQIHDGAVLVRRPNGAIATQEACSGTLLAAEAARAIKKAGSKPLESHWRFRKFTANFVDHVVDHAAAYQRLADECICGPLGAMR